MPQKPARSPRPPLSRDGVLAAAVALADEDGVSAVSMRRLAERLGVEAMSLYHHVANKDAILDAMVDSVFAEITVPDGDDWRAALRRRTASARDVLKRHPWAVGLMDSRVGPGPHTLRHHDAVIGSLLAGGFTVAGAAHAFSVLDSYLYGFVLQEISLPFDPAGEDLTELADGMFDQLPRDQFPNLVTLMVEHALVPGYSYAQEFDIGLDLVLDGLERARAEWR